MPLTAHKPHSYEPSDIPATYAMPANVASSKPTTTGQNYTHPHAATSVGKAVGFRMFKTIKRGQLPFLLAFFACVMIFFGALSGVGFSDTTSASRTDSHHTDAHFTVDSDERSTLALEEKLREMKKLENEWAARRRTAKDGAWMKANRDQKAIRRKPLAKTPQEKKMMEQENLSTMQPEQSIEEDASIPQIESDDTPMDSLQ